MKSANALNARYASGDPEWQVKLWGVILNGRYSFSSQPVWRLVSEEAKDLVSRLLTVDEGERMTAAEALQHPWFTADFGMETEEEAGGEGEAAVAVAVAAGAEEYPGEAAAAAAAAAAAGGGSGRPGIPGIISGGGSSGSGRGSIRTRMNSGDVHLSESMEDLRRMDFKKAAHVVVISNRLAGAGFGGFWSRELSLLYRHHPGLPPGPLYDES